VAFGLIAAWTVAWAGGSAAAASGDQKAKQAEAKKAFEAYAQAYLWNKEENPLQAYQKVAPLQRHLPRAKGRLLRKTYPRARQWPPSWWDQTRSATGAKFAADIWQRRGDPLQAFAPQGVSARQAETETVRQGNQYRRRVVDLKLMAMWKPALINNPNLAKGDWAKQRGVKKQHLSEAIVWHELGHAYVVEALPIRHAVQLFTKHEMLFRHLQEFYADMTTLAHASPPARRPILWIRLQGLDFYNRENAHTRAAHGRRFAARA
jgi:hypothetical protein